MQLKRKLDFSKLKQLSLKKSMPFLILIMVLALSIGYSAFVSVVNISKIVTEVRLKEDIRITGVSVASVANTGTSSICTVTTDQGIIGVIDTGDIVTCTGNSISQNFYVMPDHDNASTGTVSLLSEKNIDWSSDIQSSNAEATIYAEETYWTSRVNGELIYNESSNLHQYVELYKETLEYMGITVEEATVPSLNQLTELGCTYAVGTTTGTGSCSSAPSWVYETSYFTGSAYSGALKVWAVKDTGALETLEADGESGIRPVIIVDESEIGINSTGGMSNYEEYNVSRISVGAYLPTSNASVTYKVEVTNYGNVEMGLLEITGLPSNLQYELTEYTLKDKICDSSNVCKLGIKKDIYVTINYTDTGYSTSTSNYDLNLDFNFQPAYNVTYTDITNNGYPTTILKTDTLVVNFGSSAPSKIMVLVGGTETTNYTYTSGKLTVPNVTGDVEIVKSSVYADAILNGADPDLHDNSLTPVVYNGSNWVVADTTSEWYDYSNQEWANAVILKSGVSKSVGDTVSVSSDIQGMFVWVPRYEYKTVLVSTTTDGFDYTDPMEIQVNFIPTTKTTASSGYRIHPAFTFGSERIPGMWVGKFETTGTTLIPTILPGNVPVTTTVKQAFSTSKQFNNYLKAGDAHMMKNSEWGAVAYLSHSKYGKYGNSIYTGANKEIYQNKTGQILNGTVQSYLTGYSNGTPSKTSTSTSIATQCTYNTLTNRGSGTGYCGGGASTTGNIYGIYDMSGGRHEVVMGVYNTSNWHTNAGFTSKPSSKYYNTYYSETVYNIYYGHALSETYVWYDDRALYVSSDYPWFIRGGYGSDGVNAGIFAYDITSSDTSYAFRVTISGSQLGSTYSS